MKILRIIIVFLFTISIVSCIHKGESRTLVGIKEKPEKERKLIDPINQAIDTLIHIPCVTLTLAVMDQNKKIIPKCNATFSYYGEGVIQEFAVTKVLNSANKTKIKLGTIGKSFDLQVHSGDNLLIQTNSFPNGIKEDLEIVYMLGDCEK